MTMENKTILMSTMNKLDKLTITTTKKIDHKNKINEVFEIMLNIQDLNYFFNNYYWYAEYAYLTNKRFKVTTKKELDLALKFFKMHLMEDLHDFIYRISA